MKRADAGRALALAAALVAAAPARADSEMHQSPLLEQGSPDACADLRQGRRQRGGYSWQFSCAGVGRSEGQGGRRGR